MDVYAERIAKKENKNPPDVIAIIDADTQYMTFPTLQSVFPEKGLLKLKAHGAQVMVFQHVTKNLLGVEQVPDFMLTFPVYVWKDTFRNLRNHVVKYHNGISFEEALLKSALDVPGYYSQFCIWMTYAYHFERHRYSFHLQPFPGSDTTYFNKFVNHSVPQIRTMLHTKFDPIDAIIKGCCFSYQLYKLNHTLMEKCFQGNTNTHYELVCENMWAAHDQNKIIWKTNNTITDHYSNVHKSFFYFKKESLKLKMKNCLNYVLKFPDTRDIFPRC